MKYLPLILLLLIAVLILKKMFFDFTDYQAILDSGGVIIDVRTDSEFYSGHIKGSLNIPLGNLSSSLNHLKDKDQAIITCCASGVRSAGAQKLLSAKGYTNVVNGGGWSNLERKLKQN